MRTVFAAALLLGVAALAPAQPPKDPEPRYGVKVRAKQYPQENPKAALKSALVTIEAADYPYLVTQLLDPKFVDDAVTDRIRLFDAAVTAELTQLRDFQRANPDKVAAEDRVPLDPKAFGALVIVKARERAYKQLLRDVEQKLTDDPQTVKDMRRLAREGTVADADPTATLSHPDVKGRTLYFKKIGERWFLENRQAEEPKKEP
jgi:hypothetical protein